MSVLVGDVIMAVRSIIPDMPGVIAPPVLPTIAVVVAASSTLPPANYYLRFSLTTPWGESSASVESPMQNVPAGSGILITGAMPFGATSLRAYFGPQGAENQVVDIPALPYTIIAPGSPGIIPNINRAYHPDFDGAVFPAITVYGWLRDGLKQMADLIGGIYDATGINTTSGIPMYQLNGDWKKMTHAWVDGWPFELGNKGQVFYRTKVTTSGSGIVVTDLRGVNSIIEYYPVPDRNGGSTVTTADVSADYPSIPCQSLDGFLLAYGLALIGTPAAGEVIAYQQQSGTVLANCLRGMSGTRSVAWPAGTPVLELNGRFAGYRYPYLPRLGDALAILDCPPVWDTKLQLYMESRYREAERRFKESSELRQTFTTECKSLAAGNRDLMGPKQVGDTYTTETYGSGAGGGWLLP